MKKAIVSVSDKTNLIPFVSGLIGCGYEIISTGGTYKYLASAGIKVTAVEEITHFPEILDGRVKTLHPKIHGGILSIRDNPNHQIQVASQKIDYIDLVCVNLYPFKETILRSDVSEAEIIENIDIGGPALLRSSAKNFRDVTVICDSNDYDKVLQEIRQYEDTTLETKKTLAAKVFRHTASYDALIADYFMKQTNCEFPKQLTLTYELAQNLRYGENPHQKAALYKTVHKLPYSVINASQLHGKELSYNNIQDANAALQILREYDKVAVIALKHMNPCGIGLGRNLLEAYNKAYEADPVSIFGGIIATNAEVDRNTALEMSKTFLEIIIAPSFSSEALEVLQNKKNLRLLVVDMTDDIQRIKQSVSIVGGLLVQEDDSFTEEVYQCVTNRKPTDEELKQLLFAYKAVKHVKSNAIVLAKDNMTIGIGAGQMNRVGAAEIAVSQAGIKAVNAVMASDAFFPMRDTVDVAGKAGIKAIIQPGGSIKDQESIDACNEYGIAMIFTGVRHFKH